MGRSRHGDTPSNSIRHACGMRMTPGGEGATAEDPTSPDHLLASCGSQATPSKGSMDGIMTPDGIDKPRTSPIARHRSGRRPECGQPQACSEGAIHTLDQRADGSLRLRFGFSEAGGFSRCPCGVKLSGRSWLRAVSHGFSAFRALLASALRRCCHCV
jgi:hypothetical protein